MNKEVTIRSLLPLQILYYLHQWYLLFWFLIEILVFIYKGQSLPFASGVLAGEVVLFITLFFVDLLRIFFGTKANLTERVFGMVGSIIFAIPSIAATLYYILWQHYVLRIELITNIIQIIFTGTEVFLGLIALIIFARAP